MTVDLQPRIDLDLDMPLAPTFPTAEEIAALFAKYKLTPRRGTYYLPKPEGSGAYACALGALGVDTISAPMDSVSLRVMLDAIRARYGVTPCFTNGIICGFDDLSSVCCNRHQLATCAERDAGTAIGRATYALVAPC